MAATRLYLDHNATTPVDGRVLERFLAVERQCPGNPASQHQEGQRARAALETARASLAARLGVAPDDVVFTSGGTEANNLAVRGLGDPGLPVLLSAAEHPSVREPARHRGTVAMAVDAAGRAVPADPDRPVGLVCLVHGQSETGTLQPVEEALQLARRLGVPLHVDAAQTAGRVPLDALAGVDSVTLSPHKCGGLRGIGVLVVRGGAARVRPLLWGGGQERGVRPGTVSPAACAAAAFALELALDEREGRAASMHAARVTFLAELTGAAVAHRCLTPLADSLPNTLLLELPGIDGRILLPALDLAGLAVSQGSACSSGAPTPPAVLAAMGLCDERARACVRFSFGSGDDAAHGARAGARVAAVVARLQRKI